MDTQSTDLRARKERLAGALREKRKRIERRKQEDTDGGLIEFVRYFWHVLEPNTPFVEGWALHSLCSHLEAVTRGEINRLLVNVPPGFMKSMLVDVFWPAWEWGPMNMAHLRYVAFSYAAHLTERDNGKFRDLIQSRDYQDMWGHRVKLREDGKVRVSNDATGWKFASSVKGVGTGERGDRVILDDPHNVKEGESEAVRSETVRWVREGMSNRLNDMERGVIICIMQRVHENDVSGALIEDDLGYVHLCIPMEYEADRHCSTPIWSDPREQDGELAWTERFASKSVSNLKRTLGPYAYAGQYQQRPEPRGGGIIKREFWQLWESPNGKFPPLDYVLVSADTAYTEKEENDPTGCTVWGLFKDKKGNPSVILLHAWRRRLELHGKDDDIARLPTETEPQWIKRTQSRWGLCEWLAFTCRRFKADRLIIEGKASGLSVAQELRRLHRYEGWGVETVTPDGDKVARAYAVQSIFAAGLVYAPDRDWADMVISEMASFPKGTFKDLTDSTTQALKHLREVGLAIRPEERAEEEKYRARHRPPEQPLYDA